jgi:thymidylate kinase
MKGMRENLSHTLFRGDKGIGTPEAPIVRRDKNVRSPLMSLFRMALYVVDAISLRQRVERALRSGVDVVIFDRYLYDELANLNLENKLTRLYVRWVMKLVPRPDVSFLLDANPIQARARKPEYPLEFLYSNRNAYLKLSQFLGGITVVPSMPIDDVKQHVVQSVLGSAA